MKKYLLVPIPALLALLCSIVMRSAKPHPDNAIGATARDVEYFAHTYFNVGVIVSVSFLGILIIYDITASFENEPSKENLNISLATPVMTRNESVVGHVPHRSIATPAIIFAP